MNEITKCGYAALIGAPNAGKSTLLNALVGTKIAIVTHKVQTTRTRITAIALHQASQIIFVDTPGIFSPRRRLDRAMVEAAWGGAEDADIIVVLVDVRKGITDEVRVILKGLEKVKRPVWLALNKIDTLRKDALLALSTQLSGLFDFAHIYMISALGGDGVEDLKTGLAAAMPQGPWLYPEDQIADLPQRLLAAEVTREKIFLRLHKELPYHSTVETENWKRQKDGSIRIEQVIYVERDSQKMIVLGKGGQSIREIGRLAREDLSRMLDTKVHLFLFVKVRRGWGDDPERYSSMGLTFPKGK